MNKEWQIKEAERINEKFGNENFQPVNIDRLKNSAEKTKKEKQNNGKNQHS